MPLLPISSFFFFFNDTATTEIYTLSLHDALPISTAGVEHYTTEITQLSITSGLGAGVQVDRKSTRLNSSHDQISYAVFCLKKKKENTKCHLENLTIVHRLGLIRVTLIVSAPGASR